MEDANQRRASSENNWQRRLTELTGHWQLWAYESRADCGRWTSWWGYWRLSDSSLHSGQTL